MTASGFPHSDIHGSTLAYSSPWHFGVRPVLRRLLAPRHPPCALPTFTCFNGYPFMSVNSVGVLRYLVSKVQPKHLDNALVGLRGLEPLTSRLSVVRSSQLSYRPNISRKPQPFRDGSLKTKHADKRGYIVLLRRKEVIQPHLPIRLPCYDFTPIVDPTFGGWLLTVTSPTSGVANSRGVTGGVYKARERIHRGMLIRDY
jgi:hypothetical protein